MPSPSIQDGLSAKYEALERAARLALNNLGDGHVSERTGRICTDCAVAVEALRRALGDKAPE